VTWVNLDNVTHTVIGSSFDSKMIEKGQSYSFTFNESGTFKYHCSIHPSMQGNVIVKKSAI
jgi:plastocyanin